MQYGDEDGIKIKIIEGKIKLRIEQYHQLELIHIYFFYQEFKQIGLMNT